MAAINIQLSETMYQRMAAIKSQSPAAVYCLMVAITLQSIQLRIFANRYINCSYQQQFIANGCYKVAVYVISCPCKWVMSICIYLHQRFGKLLPSTCVYSLLAYQTVLPIRSSPQQCITTGAYQSPLVCYLVLTNRCYQLAVARSNV